MMKVKYTGKRGIYYHNQDWFNGDVKEVANDLVFDETVFEIIKEVKKVEKTTKKTSKKSSKFEE